MTKASDSAEPFGPELKAEGLVAGHQSLRKDVITFLYYMIDLSVNDKYAFPGRTTFLLAGEIAPGMRLPTPAKTINLRNAVKVSGLLS
jgi:hypothetical protein